MQKNTIYILTLNFLYLACLGQSVCAADFQLARVISVDFANKQFYVNFETIADNEKTTIPGKGKPVVVTLPLELWELAPMCIQGGELIRLWGNYDSHENSFAASDIRGTKGGQKDRSGVRSRLGRGWRHGWRNRQEASPKQ